MPRNEGTSLDHAVAQKAIHAVRRIIEINGNVLVNPKEDAEKAGLQKFVNEVVSAHADELLACWSAVRFEYEPFVGSISLVLDRVSSIRRNRQLANQVPAQPPENDTKPLTQDNGEPTADAADHGKPAPAAEAEPSNIIHVTR